MRNIPEILKSRNMVFHYTKASTAIEYILHEGELLLTPRLYSIDPIESTRHWYSNSSYGYPETPVADIEIASGVKDFITEKLEHTKQVCFCMNHQTGDFDNCTIIPYEYYGFLKPRMWDQYAEKYKGVCLAFSLDMIRKNSDFINAPIDYVDYNILQLNHISIDLNRLHMIGLEAYCDELFQRVQKTLFRKHSDYLGENEHRLISFTNNDLESIKLSDALKCIIVSEGKVNEFTREQLEKFAVSYKVELVYIKWDECGLSISTKKQHDKLITEIEKDIERLAKP